MRSAAARRDVSRVSPPVDDHAVRVALILTLPTIGLEQLLHTDRWTLAALPLYQVLHWLSDSLLALPLAAGAVWGGQRLAHRLGLDASHPPRHRRPGRAHHCHILDHEDNEMMRPYLPVP